MFDVIVIGGRVAGSSTAMLLARKGYRVLILEKDSFPSDTLSTHQVQLPGIARLKRWGLLDRVIATDAPPTRQVLFDQGGLVLRGKYPVYEGVDAIYSPRRIYLDKILMDAAVEAGAEKRENFIVEELLMEDGQVVGVRGRNKNGGVSSENARLVIGADGRHSLVARRLEPPTYDEKPALSFGYYSYFSGVPMEGGEICGRGQRSVGGWPTNHGLTMIYVAGPTRDFHQFRAGLEENFLAAIDLAPHLSERVRAGQREERIYGTADLPNYYRKPYGPGWALVGDAGYLKDPVTAQGIGDAFRDAELLVEAIDAGFSGRKELSLAMADYEARRNRESKPMYEFTAQVASFAPPPPEQVQLFEALRTNQAATDQFFGVLTGAVPLPVFMAPDNLFRILGFGRMVKVMAQKFRSALQPAAQQSSLPQG